MATDPEGAHGGLTCKETEDLNDDITGQLNDVGYSLHRLGYKIDLKEQDDVSYWAYKALLQSKTDRDALQARIAELEAALRSSRDKADRMIAGSDRNYARIQLLTAALTEIADEADPCTDEYAARNFVDCPVCGARAALAAGKEES